MRGYDPDLPPPPSESPANHNRSGSRVDGGSSDSDSPSSPYLPPPPADADGGPSFKPPPMDPSPGPKSIYQPPIEADDGYSPPPAVPKKQLKIQKRQPMARPSSARHLDKLSGKSTLGDLTAAAAAASAFRSGTPRAKSIAKHLSSSRPVPVVFDSGSDSDSDSSAGEVQGDDWKEVVDEETGKKFWYEHAMKHAPHGFCRCCSVTPI